MRAERTVHYPLRNLGEDNVLRSSEGSCDLVIWVRSGATEHGPVVVGEVWPARHQPQEREGDGRLVLARLSAPRLMRAVSGLARFGTAQDRRAIDCLREIHYRRARTGGETETHEFLRQGLALVAAMLERRPMLQVPSRWRQRAELLAGLEPTAVADWRRCFKR